jgi:hypothetical protein
VGRRGVAWARRVVITAGVGNAGITEKVWGCREPAVGSDLIVARRKGAHQEESVKYILMMKTNSARDQGEWRPEDVQASGAHMMRIYQELTGRGELVGAEKLAGPEAAKIVTSDGVGAPVVTDGPFPEAKEMLAGFWLIDVESEQRAIEIAARTSAAPGAGGRPTRYPIEVRPIMTPRAPME